MSKEDEITIALAGQPNVGKSTVFNMLTGLSQHVGNWPGKTVELKFGKISLDDRSVNLVDLPGTYSLTASSEEERVARDFIISEKPNLVVVIVNATSLESNLYLLTEMLALDVPLVIGINMMDVADRQGIFIDPHVLEAALMVPVVPLVATRNQGLKELIQQAVTLAENPDQFQPNRPKLSPEYCQLLKKIQNLMAGRIPEEYSSYWVSLKILEGDQEMHALIQREAPDIWSRLQGILLEHEEAIMDITSSRYAWIERMVRAGMVRPKHGLITRTDRLDRIATHHIWGVVALLIVLGLLFFLTYNVALPIVDMLQVQIVVPVSNLVRGFLSNGPDWFSGLIVDGLIGGVGNVLTFVPLLILFFVFLGVLEDAGYLARVAFVMDPMMHWLGLHGRSFLTFFLGFGCNVPAVMGTRIIEDKRARWLTIFLIPLVPCTARMAVVTFLVPAFFGKHAAAVTLLLVFANLGILVLLGKAAKHFVFKGQQSPFIMEMPLYHMPNLRSIGLYVWENTLAFLKKAGGLIVAFSIIVWTLSWFPEGNLQTSFIARFGRWMAPFWSLIGLRDWRIIVALLSSFIAKENTIATLGVLFSQQAQTVTLPQQVSAIISPVAAVSFLLIQMLFVPCIATVAVINKETLSWRFTLLSVMSHLLISLVVGIGFFQLASWVGTIF